MCRAYLTFLWPTKKVIRLRRRPVKESLAKKSNGPGARISSRLGCACTRDLLLWPPAIWLFFVFLFC